MELKLKVVIPAAFLSLETLKAVRLTAFKVSSDEKVVNRQPSMSPMIKKSSELTAFNVSNDKKSSELTAFNVSNYKKIVSVITFPF